MGTRAEVWFFSNAADIARQIEPPGAYDACYVPHSAHVTGDIGIHEIAWADSELWIVSTRFSCLCTLDPDYSFVPRWRPSFISALVAEDRCHLNGLAMVGGQPGYVTALGTTDTRGGWRDDKVHGGCVIHVPSGELISQGFTRGLALVGPVAFVGLSKVRPTSAMDGVPIATQWETLKCGVAAVDLRCGRLLGMLEFQSAVEEIFDVQILPHSRFPEIMGFQQDSLAHTFIVPPELKP